MTNPVGSFYKSEDCPASDQLLAFQTGREAASVRAKIRGHIDECEFCAAEVEFYRLYPPSEETVDAEKMPEPLFELADALLRKERDLSSLYNLVDEGN